MACVCAYTVLYLQNTSVQRTWMHLDSILKDVKTKTQALCAFKTPSIEGWDGVHGTLWTKICSDYDIILHHAANRLRHNGALPCSNIMGSQRGIAYIWGGLLGCQNWRMEVKAYILILGPLRTTEDILTQVLPWCIGESNKQTLQQQVKSSERNLPQVR